MYGQIAGPSVFSLELVALIVGISMIVGAVDLIRQPGWAWKRAEESKAAYLILVVLVPIVGLSLYVFRGRPKVSAIAAAGRAASLPFERFGEEPTQAQHESTGRSGRRPSPVGASTPSRSRRPTATGVDGRPTVGPDDRTGPVEVSGTFFSSGGTATKTRPPVGLTRTYRPKQRTSLAVAEDDPRVHRARRVEGRPDRTSPVPLLGRVPLDRERGRRRRAVAGRGGLLTGRPAPASVRVRTVG